MRNIKDFKIPNFKFKKIKMDDIPDVENVNVNYEDVKEAEEKKKSKKGPYEIHEFNTIKEIFENSISKYPENTVILQRHL